MLSLLSGVIAGTAVASGGGVQDGTSSTRGWAIQRTFSAVALTNISCASAKFCVAVGTDSRYRLVAKLWDGTKWRSSPSTGSGAPDAAAISCPTRRFCMVVGSATDDLFAAESPFAAVYNGRGWIARNGVIPDGDNGPAFNDVSCPSATSCTAVGQDAKTNKSVIENWNGSYWTVETPVKGKYRIGTLDGVSCSASDRCVFVGGSTNELAASGSPLVLTQDGGNWDETELPNPAGTTNANFTRVACPTPRWCEAIGSANFQKTTGGDPQISGVFAAAWNGSSWNAQPLSPFVGTLDSTILRGLSCLSVNDCYAVGDVENVGGDVNHPADAMAIVEVLQGSGWRLEPTPPLVHEFSLVGARLGDISCIASLGHCVAAGYYARGTSYSDIVFGGFAEAN